ncbi:DNA repair exonuclease [Aulographum hederae CBS 113979]|uniref:Double-strand break repair protein n=1 Tax=Aulographum hederae CBS 113979 TaxID=1176131 RepID=A0A6G1H8C9_9PEZI|nr:DNA repair exonuclease [Aulographum hederae CBS 113979]
MADTITILIATDNHVGYNERDPIRGNDSWQSFHEVMCLAKARDVDMVLLAGDLFHENKPSRKSMYQVMRSLRMNCYGDRPCELEMLGDGSEAFGGPFDHVNYEDADINVAIPVFSIHGNHDDPSGEGHLAALDLLQISGLLNYYGRTPESDNIVIKPVLLQKGQTKLALYGMSNVRDERLFRTFRDGKVRFFQPNTQKDDWFNLMSVHQNHHAYTETGYLPENFLPSFLDLVVWGHEHECLIEPRRNPETSFHVMQPGSSVATSLMPTEAVPKHVSIVSVTGKSFKSEPIRLKSVRPFIMREIVLAEERALKNIWKKDNNRAEITRYLMAIVDEMIKEAAQQWQEAHEDDEEPEDEEDRTPPLPLIRLRVEYTAPEGGKFDCENPQRFSNRFVGKVANVNDVIQFHRRKTTNRTGKAATDLPEESIMAEMTIDKVGVDRLVKEFLTAQSLTILPQNSFGDAVSQFVDKDDKHAMEMFVNESLSNQIQHLLSSEDVSNEDITEAMETFRTELEGMFEKGHLKRARKSKFHARPDNWDSDMDGDWEDQPAAIIHSDEEDEEDEAASVVSRTPGTRGRGRGRGRAKAATTSTRKTPAAAPKKVPARGSRAKKQVVEEESEDEDVIDDDVVMIDDEDDDEEEELFVRPAKKPAARTTRKAPSPRRAPARSSRQTTLNFSQPATQSNAVGGRRNNRNASDDDISDDDDAFDPPPPSSRQTRRR